MKMWYKSSFTRHCRQIKVTHDCVYSQKCGRVCLRPTAVNYWQGPGTSQENEDMEKTSEWQGTTKHISPSPNSIYATRQLVDTCLWNNSGKCLRGKWMSTRARQIPKISFVPAITPLVTCAFGIMPRKWLQNEFFVELWGNFIYRAGFSILFTIRQFVEFWRRKDRFSFTMLDFFLLDPWFSPKSSGFPLKKQILWFYGICLLKKQILSC